jgi:hypothetical protein
MKTSLLRLGAVIGLSIGALALPTTAFAGGGGGLCSGSPTGGQVMSCHFSGLFAQAGFQSGSLATTETDVSIGAMDGRGLQAASGGPVQESDVYVSISKLQADPTSPKGITVVAELWGDVPVTSGLTIDKSLGSASVTVDIPVSGFDENGPVNGRVITVSASWTGTGAITRSSGMYRYHSGGFLYQERFASSDRAASVTGTAIDNGIDWLSGLAPTYADLESASDATLYVSHS